jgi:hypothetical protein
MSDNTVFQEVQAALLNSECDPNEAGKQGLCALYSFVATELEGTKLHKALERALSDVRLPPPPYPGEVARKVVDVRKHVRNHVLAREAERKRTR